MGDNQREYANFLAGINPHHKGGSTGSSHMMIEITDVDIKDPLQRSPTGKIQ